MLAGEDGAASLEDEQRPAQAPLVAMTPAEPVAAIEGESGKLAGEKFDPSSAKYKSLVAAASANRSSPSGLATDDLSSFAAVALRQSKGSAARQRFVQIASEAKAHFGLADRADAPQPVLAS